MKAKKEITIFEIEIEPTLQSFGLEPMPDARFQLTVRLDVAQFIHSIANLTSFQFDLMCWDCLAALLRIYLRAHTIGTDRICHLYLKGLSTYPR